MKNEVLVNGVLIFILTLVFVFVFGVPHEMTHYAFCEMVGLEGDVTIDIFQNPPLFVNNCDGINEKSTFSKYLVWGTPYITGLIIMILLFMYLPRNKFYMISIPLALIFSVFQNLVGFYDCMDLICNYGNDLLQLYFKARAGLYFTFFLIGITAVFFVLTGKDFILKFCDKFRKKN